MSEPLAAAGILAPRQRSGLAFLYAVPIGLLGGLIGLGGAEFRLPVLVGPLKYSARQAVPLNLAVSLVTLMAAFLTRGRTLSFAPIAPFLPAILALIVGAVIAAFFGTAWQANFPMNYWNGLSWCCWWQLASL